MSVYQVTPPPDLSTREENFVTWENAFSLEELSLIRKIGDNLAIGEGTIGGETSTTDTEVRQSKVGWIACTSETQFIYDRLGYVLRMINGEYFNFDMYGFVEDFQYTVYTSNSDHYSWHIDKGNLNSSPRKISMVLQLSDPSEYEGGELEFQFGPSATVAQKKQGKIHAFPSWILHRVTPVTRGTRKTLVIWAAGPKFR